MTYTQMKIYHKYNAFNKKYHGSNFYVYKHTEMIRKLYTYILYLNNVTFVQTEEDGCEQCNDTFDEHM